MSAEQSSRESCVVWGGYGYGNTGDDLLLAIAVADLRQHYGDNIQILSPAPEQTRLYLRDAAIVLHPSSRPRRAWEKWLWRLAECAEKAQLIPLADRLHRAIMKNAERLSDEPTWLKAMACASRLHLAGGGYLTDRFHLRHFLRPMRLARSRGIPITTSPLGLGPFQNPANAAAVARCLRGAKLIVRDEDSLRYCQAQGLSVIEQPDDGFRWKQMIDTPAPSASTADRILGVCIFSQYSDQWSDRVERWWVDSLRGLSRAWPDYKLEGFCFHTQPDMDYETTRRLFARAELDSNDVQPPHSDYRAALANLARYQGILSSRFHAVVTGSAIHIPCVATALDTYYEAKMRAALKYAPAPVLILNPAHDSAHAAAEWVAGQFRSPLRSKA
ncbi:MAG TPA: polysaccharide pyruvyl transferase family protein [Verrucomicrobiae bacterium]|nr:polysaccharide pyruvyl transferase family protein [Verrucomicrobiae bacterium]